MIKKAEEFKLYLEKNNLTAFQMEEIEQDENRTVVFRTHITVQGHQIPSALIFDNSIFTMIRVQISPQALTRENEQVLGRIIHSENEKYKPFKFYLNGDGNLMMDVCLIILEDAVNVEEVLLMYRLVINYLDASYPSLMKAVW